MHLLKLLLLLPALAASGILAAPVANSGMESHSIAAQISSANISPDAMSSNELSKRQPHSEAIHNSAKREASDDADLSYANCGS